MEARQAIILYSQSEYRIRRKTNADGQILPRVGKVASGASRIGFWRDEKERRRSSQVRRLREHPSAADEVPLSQWGRQRGGGFAVQKGSQPRLAALGSPFQGKGLAWILPPSYGRRCPEGAEVGWGKRDEKRSGEIVTSAPFARVPLSQAKSLPLEGVESVTTDCLSRDDFI